MRRLLIILALIAAGASAAENEKKFTVIFARDYVAMLLESESLHGNVVNIGKYLETYNYLKALKTPSAQDQKMLDGYLQKETLKQLLEESEATLINYKRNEAYKPKERDADLKILPIYIDLIKKLAPQKPDIKVPEKKTAALPAKPTVQLRAPDKSESEAITALLTHVSSELKEKKFFDIARNETGIFEDMTEAQIKENSAAAVKLIKEENDAGLAPFLTAILADKSNWYILKNGAALLYLKSAGENAEFTHIRLNKVKSGKWIIHEATFGMPEELNGAPLH